VPLQRSLASIVAVEKVSTDLGRHKARVAEAEEQGRYLGLAPHRTPRERL
jgi:hypothetical protein